MGEEMYRETVWYIEEIILAHEKGGMEAVEILVEEDDEKWKNVLDQEHFTNGQEVFWARHKSAKKKTFRGRNSVIDEKYSIDYHRNEGCVEFGNSRWKEK